MESFVIDGAYPRSGRVRAAGNKNAALPIIAACLLTDEPVTLTNVPGILDVETMLELVARSRRDVERGHGEVVIHASETPRTSSTRSSADGSARRSSSPARCSRAAGEAVVPPPGGDVIGRRRLDTHVHAFEQLGADIRSTGATRCGPARSRGCPIFLDEASVTGTENAVMAAVLARGETVIANAASEPHVQDLCRFLVALGAEIDGIGINVLRIRGVERLRRRRAHGSARTTSRLRASSASARSPKARS